MTEAQAPHPDQFSSYPREHLQPGAKLLADLFLFLPVNRTFVHFRRKGDLLSEADHQSVSRLSNDQVLVPKEQLSLFPVPVVPETEAKKPYTMESGPVEAKAAPVMESGPVEAKAPPAFGEASPPLEFSSGGVAREKLDPNSPVKISLPGAIDDLFLKGTPPDSPEVQEAVVFLFKQIDFGDDTEFGIERRKRAIGQLPTLINNLVSRSKKIQNVQTFERILKLLKNVDDPLTAHMQQVSALATMMMVTVGTASMDDVVDVALAGMIHDMGLRRVSRRLQQAYLEGKLAALPQDEMAKFNKHSELSLETFRKSQTYLNPSVTRIVKLHHEQWDGSGPQKTLGIQTYRPARLLRICDELVIRLFLPENRSGLYGLLLQLSKEMATENPIEKYDPQMLGVLLKKLKPDAQA